MNSEVNDLWDCFNIYNILKIKATGFWQICEAEVKNCMWKFRLPEKCLVELVKFNVLF